MQPKDGQTYWRTMSDALLPLIVSFLPSPARLPQQLASSPARRAGRAPRLLPRRAFSLPGGDFAPPQADPNRGRLGRTARCLFQVQRGGLRRRGRGERGRSDPRYVSALLFFTLQMRYEPRKQAPHRRSFATVEPIVVLSTPL
jgi:hypothetical protein